MSSADSGRYQSRFFRFLAKHSQKLADNCDRALRHLKFASAGAVQFLLYPIYLLLQTTRFASRQLHQATQRFLPQLPDTVNEQPEHPPAAKTTLQRLLSVTQNLSAARQAAKAEKAAAANVVSVPAVAVIDRSDTATHPLNSADRPAELPQATVPETSANPSNRAAIEALTDRLTNHLSVILDETAQPETLPPQPPPTDSAFNPALAPLAVQNHLLPPLRYFWQLMAWVQTSPIALKANLFGETAVVKVNPEPAIDPPANPPINNPSLPTHHPLTLLDHVIAELEEFLPGVADYTPNLAPPNQGRLQTQGSQTASYLNFSNSPKEQVTNSTSESYRDRIQALIQAAINYFFGNEASFRSQDPTPSFPKSDRPELRAQESLESEAEVNPSEERPWLTLHQLFGEPTLPPATASGETAITPQATQNQPTTTQPDYLETQATSSGYVQHPLEIILSWLDRAMLWIEELVLQIWNWAKAQLPNILNKN